MASSPSFGQVVPTEMDASTVQEPRSSTGSRGRRYYPELDGLRGMSVMLVVIGHLALFVLRSGSWGGSLAAMGVMIFFILSGFLITDLLCHEHAETGTVRLGAFYVRRIRRLMPAFLVFVLFLAIAIQMGWVTDVPWSSMAASLVHLRNVFGRGDTNAHLWSLSMEEQFYAVWPLLFLLAGPRKALVVSLVGVLGVSLVRGGMIALNVLDYNRGIYYLRPWFRFDSLLLGCLLALAWNGGERSRRLVQKLVAWCSPGVCLVALTLWSVYAEMTAMKPVFLLVQGLLAAALVAGCALGGTHAWLRLRSLRFLGLISYSLYLWQQPFLTTRTPDWGPLREAPLCVVMAFAAALASYYWVEKPFRVAHPEKATAKSVTPGPQAAA